MNAGNVMDIASGASGLITSGIQSYKKMSELPETEDELGAIDNIASLATNVNSFDDLQSLFNNARFARTDYSQNDLLGMSKGQAALNIVGDSLSQGMQGAQAGLSAGGPWGALIGGAIGTVQGALTSGIGWGVRKGKADRLAADLNKQGREANESFLRNVDNSKMNIMTNIKNNALLNIVALGGPLDTTFTNGVRFITEGGSHSQNPLGGVPQGIATDGIPNLVEEGEIIYNDYVYSKRLKVPQADKESLGLKKDKEYTYADAAKQIQKESEERPNDPISKRNLAEMMGRLQGSQETLKEKREGQALKRAINKMTPDELAMFTQQLQQPQQMQPMMSMQGMQPMQPTQSEVPMFGKGGLLGHKHVGPGSISFLNVPTSFNFSPTTEQDALDSYTDAYGFKPSLDLELDANLTARQQRLKQAADLPWDTAIVSDEEHPLFTSDLSLKGFEQNKRVNAAKEALDSRMEKFAASSANSDSTDNKGSFSVAQALRAAPVFGSLASSIASLFDKPNYSNTARAERAMASVPRVSSTPIGQRMAYNPIDINYIATQQANNALGARRALAEYGAGNPAGIQQAVIANNYANQTALGQALMQANQLNRQNLAQALEFNRQTDSANAASNLQAALANQQRDMNAAEFLFRTGQLRDAELGRVQANRSANLTNLFNNLGNLGTDMLNRDAAMAMAQSYGVPYNSYMDTAGNTAFGYKWTPNPNRESAKGGKLNTKKGGKNA